MQMHIYTANHMIRKTLICAMLLAAAILPVREAQAVITGVTTIPASRNVAIRHAASVSLTWKVSAFDLLNFTGLGPSVSSQQGVFRTPAGQTLGSVNTPLITTGTLGGVFVLIKEQLLVPASIVARARSLKANQIQYIRVFSSGTTAQGTLLLNITGSAGAGFNISREALSFTDK